MAHIPNALDIHNPADMAWVKKVGGLKLTLNGEPIDRVVSYNRKEGWVERLILSPVPGAGNGIVLDGEGNILTRVYKGRVEVQFVN